MNNLLYLYTELYNNWEIAIYNNNGQLLLTLIADKSIKGSLESLGIGTLMYDFSKQEDVQSYIDFQLNNPVNKVYFDNNGKLQKQLSDLERRAYELSGETPPEITELGALKIKYPSSQLPPTESTSNSK